VIDPVAREVQAGYHNRSMLQSPPPSQAADEPDPYEDPEEAYLDGEEEELEEAPPRRGWWRWLLAAVFLAGTAVAAGQGVWYTHQKAHPEPRVVEPPAINPALEAAVLGAIAPGWPAKRPSIRLAAGPVEAAEGHITGLAAADVLGDGQLEWGVSYVWYGLPDEDGARASVPGFAIVTASDKPKLLYQGPGTGGWDDLKQGAFEAATEVESAVEAVRPGPREVGFLYHYTVESSRGGHLTHGRSRMFLQNLGQWVQAWEGETEFRWRTGHADELAHSASVKFEDRDGDGVPEIVTTPSHYYRHLGAGDKGPHFMAEGPGDLVYRREGPFYRLAGLAVPGARELRIRPAAPLYAVRAPGPVQIDGDFNEWDLQELAVISGIRFDDPALMKYKRREPEGLDDLGGEVNLMWDDQALYIRAMVLDNTVVPGPAGKELYKGDNLSVWLDMDLQKDFDHGLRDGDDWQIGLSPAGPEVKPDKQGRTFAQAWCWVPKPGTNGVVAASKPLVDPYNHAVRGYQIEAAVPWSGLGGPPAGLKIQPAALPMAGPASTEPRRYHLGLAGAAGIGLVLSDADTEYQELGYVSNPFFTWAEPKTFNTLLLVEPN
jgi:hypothetical protein